MTIRDTIESFRHFIEDASGRPTSDSLIPNRFMYYTLLRERNRILEREYKRNTFFVNNEVVVNIPCIPMEEVDLVELDFAPKTGCYIMKSEQPLPEMLFELPFSVTDVSGRGEFDFVRWNYFQYKLGSRVKAERDAKYYSIKFINGLPYLYLFNARGFKAASVDIVPEDVLDYHYFKGCGKERPFCSPLDEQFLIPTELQTEIFQAAYAMIQSGQALGRGTDIINNDNDDTKSPLGGKQ